MNLRQEGTQKQHLTREPSQHLLKDRKTKNICEMAGRRTDFYQQLGKQNNMGDFLLFL
jgi:hypothetical protein